MSDRKKKKRGERERGGKREGERERISVTEREKNRYPLLTLIKYYLTSCVGLQIFVSEPVSIKDEVDRVNFRSLPSFFHTPLPIHLTRFDAMPAQLKNYNVTPGVSVTTSNTFSALSSPSNEEVSQHYILSLRLIDAILEQDFPLIERLVLQERVDCWLSDEQSTQGWTSLHAAAYIGSVKLLKFLLRKGNAVWNLVDNLGCSPGDIAFSMNHSKCYKFLLEEGTRAEMLRAVMEDAAQLEDEEEQEEKTTTTTTSASTASSLSHYLSQPLTYTTDSNGQSICLDVEGNGVMMGWEREIMKQTVERMLSKNWKDRKGKQRQILIDEEVKNDRLPLRVVNVGFGLGIIDEYFQEYSPTHHLIIEPHPSVLKHAEETGWFSKPGVSFFKGTWQEWIKSLESGESEWLEFDGIYFDTYSEHYKDLREFLSQTPNLLSSNSSSSVSFFHGLGATSRSFYDVYTQVCELHLLEFGLKTEWFEVDVLGQENEGGDVWEKTGWRNEDEGGKGERKKYWEWEKAVGKYRLPICRLEY